MMSESTTLVMPCSTKIEDQFASQPTELTELIYCLLPSFQDVLSLAVAHIPGEHYARRYLAAQDGRAADFEVTASDAIRIFGNAQVVERAIRDFENRMARFNVMLVDMKSFYGTSRHPPNLTSSERRRFIRTFYQLWAIGAVERSAWEAMLGGMTVKRLYQLEDMKYYLSIQTMKTHYTPVGVVPNREHNVSGLQSEVAERINKVCKLYNQEPYFSDGAFMPSWIVAWEIGGKSLHLVRIFDWYQAMFKDDLVCFRRRRREGEVPLSGDPSNGETYDDREQEQWDDSSDEEDFEIASN